MIEKSPLASTQASIEDSMNAAGAVYTEAVRLRDADVNRMQGKEPRQYTYDPDSVPTITTDQITEIEARLHGIYMRDSSDAQQAQGAVNDALEKLGINGESVKNGVLVANIVDGEGKRMLRAFVADPADFGTNISNAELQPTAGQSHGTDRHESLPDLRIAPKEVGIAALNATTLLEGESKSSDNHLENEQGAIKGLVSSLGEKTRILKESLGMSTDSHRGNEIKHMNSRLSNLTQAVAEDARRLIHEIDFGEFNADIANRMLNAAREAKSILGRAKATLDGELAMANGFADEVEGMGASDGRRVEDAEDKKAMVRVLNHTRSAIDALQLHKKRENGANEDLASQFGRVERIIRGLIETQHYGRGYDESVSPLRQAIGAIEELSSKRLSSARLATESVANLEKWLNEQ